MLRSSLSPQTSPFTFRSGMRSISHLSRRQFASSPIFRDSKASSRFQTLNSRFPKWLQKYTLALKHAPVSHISSFLILHELTAIFPLISLTAVFHYFNWLPPFISEWKWASDGVQKFGNYFRRKGWLGPEKLNGEKAVWRRRWWQRGEAGTRIIVEFRLATAYAITKALIPLRIPLSVWATPWLARAFVIPSSNGFKRFLTALFGFVGKEKRQPGLPKPSPAAGTGATAGNALPSQPTIKKP